MTKKQKIIQLLKQEKNQNLAQLLLQKFDVMNEADFNDLYFLLTSKDKKKISKFAQKKSEKMQQQFAELKQIASEAKKMTAQYQEKKEQKKTDKAAEKLLHNL